MLNETWLGDVTCKNYRNFLEPAILKAVEQMFDSTLSLPGLQALILAVAGSEKTLKSVTYSDSYIRLFSSSVASNCFSGLANRDADSTRILKHHFMTGRLSEDEWNSARVAADVCAARWVEAFILGNDGIKPCASVKPPSSGNLPSGSRRRCLWVGADAQSSVR